ncbi:dUTP diphosphatase [Lentibacillus sediminis]|uniref:dUTP diphosphatase n=1 Tax=Lentibacillus sediminis TaxID=1940529 RepID=UPI000C1BA799|nr:dUTP diphosphatase [Lentibacillus sediminis]
MDWNKLYAMQKKLDSYIEANHETENDKFADKCLALLVEVGELANETRCFKFWSTKPRNEQSAILEEYVDGLHFILSLGLDKGYRFAEEGSVAAASGETQQFLQVFQDCTVFRENPTSDNYQKLFANYLQLGKLLGFSETDMEASYEGKNQVNYERQDTGY